MVNYLDDSIGAVVGALESRGMLENTLITFSSDNVDIFPRSLACQRLSCC